MQVIKKYWWAIILVLIVLFWITSKANKEEAPIETGGCKKLSSSDWDKKKTKFFEDSAGTIFSGQGGDWHLAHLQMLEAGYCEQKG